MNEQRDQCGFCGHRLDRARSRLFPVHCNVRKFKDQLFHFWRCPDCRTLMCLERVDLAYYYASYPIFRQTMLPYLRAAYANLLGRLTREGLSREAKILDYGCGKGLLLRYLRNSGYANCAGYDRYSTRTEFRDPAALQPLAYDAILSQDVLEHVEDMRAMLAEIDGCLRPGGLVHIGTPNADRVQPDDVRTYWSELHPPYHLHCVTPAALEALGAERGWDLVGWYDRHYLDMPWNGQNERAMVEYLWLSDGTVDAAYEFAPAFRRRTPLRLRLARWFGYWYSPKGNMGAVFRKKA